MKRYAEFFADLCLMEYDFRKYDSLTLAVSIIIAARKTVGLEPLWHEEFDVLFGANWEKVSPCYSEIYWFYKLSFPDQEQKSAKKKREPRSHSKPNSDLKRRQTIDQSASKLIPNTSTSFSNLLTTKKWENSSTTIGHSSAVKTSNFNQYLWMPTTSSTLDARKASHTRSVNQTF